MTYKQATKNSPRRIGVVSLLTRRMDEQVPLYNSDDLAIREQSSMISDVVHIYSLEYKQISTVHYTPHGRCSILPAYDLISVHNVHILQ